MDIIYKVYGIYDENGNLKYVGCTKGEVRKRVMTHISESSYCEFRKSAYSIFFNQFYKTKKLPEFKTIAEFSNPHDAGDFECMLQDQNKGLVNKVKYKGRNGYFGLQKKHIA